MLDKTNLIIINMIYFRLLFDFLQFPIQTIIMTFIIITEITKTLIIGNRRRRRKSQFPKQLLLVLKQLTTISLTISILNYIQFVELLHPKLNGDFVREAAEF
jgi:hypothetical protein